MLAVNNSPGRAGAERDASQPVYRTRSPARDGNVSSYAYETLPQAQGNDMLLSRSPLLQSQLSTYFPDHQHFSGNAYLSSLASSIPITQQFPAYAPQSPTERNSPVSNTPAMQSSVPRASRAPSEGGDTHMLNPMGTYGSLGSMVMQTPSPDPGSISDGYVDINSTFDGTDDQLHDLIIADYTPPVDDASPTSLFSANSFQDINYDMNVSPSMDDCNFDGIRITLEQLANPGSSFQQPEHSHWSPDGTVDVLPRAPWNYNGMNSNGFMPVPAAQVNSFDFARGFPYGNITGNFFLQVNQPILYEPEPVSPGGISDNSWQMVPSHTTSEADSHGSPSPNASPATHPPSPCEPVKQEFETSHSHVVNFKSTARISKAKLPRGRQRGLTAVEKKQARDVRDAKACWACHISKTKCSPCSPGKPCEQCARLDGKRRFCNFSCFNDPLEALHKFMVPDYLMGHFTKQNVESFVTRNAGFGTDFLRVRMTWGYRKYLEVEVVTMHLRGGPNNEMAVQHQTVQDGDSRPILLRKSSPPLGIPLDAMDELQDSYSRYVSEIVANDLAQYVPVAYTDQNSMLPERLLGSICNFYRSESETDNQSDLLREAIEMHVTAVILERSLILDPDSLNRVQGVLRQEFPGRSAPRCAQRQIKLAFFELQRRRIERVLKDWGNMMWATNTQLSKDQDWAISFSVFLILTLVMDKTLGAAYFFCEGRIKNHGNEPRAEKMAFANLVRLTQNELFDRCKEIFHWKFKTRKGGKEACNPIRDGVRPFLAKVNSIDPNVKELVRDLQAVVEKYEDDIKTPTLKKSGLKSEFMDAGRLSCIFLNDSVSR